MSLTVSGYVQLYYTQTHSVNSCAVTVGWPLSSVQSDTCVDGNPSRDNVKLGIMAAHPQWSHFKTDFKRLK